jgi:hypothetical protein
MSDLPETISVEEQARAAGMGKILPVGAYPDIDQLRDHIQTFFKAERNQDNHALAMAKTKAAEMDFWLRAHRAKP